MITMNRSVNLSSPAGVVFTLLVANSPQILLSFLYFAYNGIFTRMLLAEEWSAYASKRRFLRVTSPTGGQRSTYRLQLPYRYGIPLLIGSSTLHWLVSQSIFLVRVNVIDSTGVEVSYYSGISTCGYSPIALIFVIILGSIVVLLGIANGFRKARVGMPLGSYFPGPLYLCSNQSGALRHCLGTPVLPLKDSADLEKYNSWQL